MAERRMFAKAIIDSDAFTEMPTSARLLYYDLGMRGDDDGFVNSPKKIMKMTGASDDDLKILIAKKFILPFESGIIVVKHWRINNYLRNDRYRETTYLEEKSLLKIEDNGAYTFNKSPDFPHGIPKIESGIPPVSQPETQISIGKVSIDQVTIPEEKISYQTILENFKTICVDLPRPQKMTPERKKHINARVEGFGIGKVITWTDIFNKVHASDFLNDRDEQNPNRNNWKADFDWILNESNMAKILEGKYDNKSSVLKSQPITKEEQIIQNLIRQSEELQ